MGNKVYLGDGVYIEQDEYGMVILTTSNGIKVTNTLFLDDSVLHSLNEYLLNLKPPTPEEIEIYKLKSEILALTSELQTQIQRANIAEEALRKCESND